VLLTQLYTQRFRVIRVQTTTHWLDYDAVSFVVLVLGLGIVSLLALSI
jgi:hypothetical protein